MVQTIVFNDLRMFSDISCDTVAGMGMRKASKPREIQTVNTKTEQQYRLFPNPNDGNFTLYQLVPQTASALCEIINATDLSVFKGELRFEGGISHLAMPDKIPGLYLLKITDAKGNSSIIKFVIE